jgi:4-hydroxybenzoate polyprenyltransferase
VVVTALTSLLALAAGRGWAACWLAGAIASGQAALGWSNDWVDRDRDRRAGRGDKPLAADQLPARSVGIAALVALAACVPLSLLYGVWAGLAHLAAVGCGLLYNFRLKARLASFVPYLVSFGLLPVVVTLGLVPPRLPSAWSVVAAALLGLAGHLTQTLPDIPDDRMLAINGLPQRLGRRRSSYLACASLMASMAAITGGHMRSGGWPPPVSAIGLGLAATLGLGVIAAAHSGRWNLSFRLILASAALVTAAFVTEGGFFS